MDHIRPELATYNARRTATVGVILAVVVACARYEANAETDSARADSVSRAHQDSVLRAQPGYVVDSIFPIEEEIRRFNADLADPGKLSGGARNRAELVRMFTVALSRRDAVALRALLVTRAEFGFLVFPESPYTKPPYKTKPEIIWLQLLSASERGIPRLLERVGGDSASVSDLACEPVPEQQGPNRYWRKCTMMVRDTNGRTRRLQLFGHILERDGGTKFLSYESAF